MPKVILSGHIVVPASDLNLVQQELTVHIELTRQEPGCLIFDISQDVDNPHLFRVYEEFVHRSAFEAHQARVKESDWGRITADAQRHYKIREDD